MLRRIDWLTGFGHVRRLTQLSWLRAELSPPERQLRSATVDDAVR